MIERIRAAARGLRAVHLLSLLPWLGRSSLLSRDDAPSADEEQRQANVTGLPEAELTEAQRQEAVRRARNKPRIG
jgi:hypothetical protein